MIPDLAIALLSDSRFWERYRAIEIQLHHSTGRVLTLRSVTHVTITVRVVVDEWVISFGPGSPHHRQTCRVVGDVPTVLSELF